MSQRSLQTIHVKKHSLLNQLIYNKNPHEPTQSFVPAQSQLQSPLNNPIPRTSPIQTSLKSVNASLCISPVPRTIRTKQCGPLYHPGPSNNPHLPAQSFIPRQVTVSHTSFLHQPSPNDNPCQPMQSFAAAQPALSNTILFYQHSPNDNPN